MKTVENCVWVREDDDGMWAGKCGVYWDLQEGTPRDHHMNFCPSCGKPLVENLSKEHENEN